MADQIARARQADTVLLFGSQTLVPADNLIKSLRADISNPTGEHWIPHVLAGLPEWLDILNPHGLAIGLGELESAKQALSEFNVWLRTGRKSAPSFSALNVVLTPLTVANQLLQYSQYLKIAWPSIEDKKRYGMTRFSAETVGFCTGLLSAAAVACTRDRSSFEKYGGNAIRLAMLCGLVVDAQNSADVNTKTVSLSTSWNSPEARSKLDSIVEDDVLEAYLSVFYDINRATLTLPASNLEAMRSKLSQAGVTATEIALSGRFHWSGHQASFEKLLKVVENQPDFQFLDIASSVLRIRSNDPGHQFDSPGMLHREVLGSILLRPCRWYETVLEIHKSSLKSSTNSALVTFGMDRCVPPSLVRSLGPQLVSMAELAKASTSTQTLGQRNYADTDIAIVGMACKVAGADDLDEFWQILCEGQSQHREVPSERFSFKSAYRPAATDVDRKWYGNFMNHHDTFDHKFFKKTPREVASMDPQQRQILQIAYQAVEQSGYFRNVQPDMRVGCYIGVCAVDYENNVACHSPNAFSATGTLRGFIAGKISHFFGWTGPGLTLDSACSSSVVSVHLACQAILNGECSSAVAGGSHVMTSPLCYQNLAGASFLSKSGQCKPFDAAADGYCRGEGCAAVYLKKLSAAIADGDQVLAVIPSTAVQQNENCTPIVVPNAPSLTDLFRTVIGKARLKPEEIGVVEAHGTGTPVGDPAEYDSIRQIFGAGNAPRTSPLILSSVKGLIGHLECTSGMASLIKTVLMIFHGAIPPQSSFKTINPAVKPAPEDQIIIPTSVTPWNSGYRAALINNYGASGSNASMVVVEAPRMTTKNVDHIPGRGDAEGAIAMAENDSYHPNQLFWIPGMDDLSIADNASALRRHVAKYSAKISLAELAFNLSRQSNRTLPRRSLFAVRSIQQLDEQLARCGHDNSVPAASYDQNRPGPVVLCFGGQISNYVGLSTSIFDSVPLLRKHLYECDDVCVSLGAGSIFPSIFQREPISDTVKLQTALFAMQYSTAKCWIDSGVQLTAVLGHSFGELTASCISDVLSLDHALLMIVARATIIRDQWSTDKGAMMAVESDLVDVERLMGKANARLAPHQEPVVVACYNGSRSLTLAGSTAAIDSVAEILSSEKSSSIRSKRLNVTNAFHSTLVDPLVSALKKSAKDLKFHPPKIEWARCTQDAHGSEINAAFLGEHMRQPVYFHQCVQRLSQRYPDCVWLEGGSNATVTTMVSRALGAPARNHFIPVNISSGTAWDNLAASTLALWTAGINVSFWPHTGSVPFIPMHILPPYQFAKSKHWIELKESPAGVAADANDAEIKSVASAKANEPLPDTLLTFIGYADERKRHARFRVNTMIPQYEKLMAGHVIAHTAPICPATVQIDLAIDGLMQIVQLGADFNPEIHQIENSAPICVDPSLSVWLDLENVDENPAEWGFKFTSTKDQDNRRKTVHTSGRIVPSAKHLTTRLELSRLQRFISHNRCLDLLESSDPDEAIQGRAIYKSFAEIVNYGEQYRGLTKVVGKGSLSAGRVVKCHQRETWFDAHLSDAFCQVGGIFVNCMTSREESNIYIASGIERWQRSPDLQPTDRPASYDVLAFHNGSVDSGAFLTDLFVFDPNSGKLVEAIMGVKYVQVSKASMAKLLTRLSAGAVKATAPDIPSSHGIVSSKSAGGEMSRVASGTEFYTALPPTLKTDSQGITKKLSKLPDVLPRLRNIISDLSGFDRDRIELDSSLSDLGIDSLMAMELITELEREFRCSFPVEEAAEITNMTELVACTHRRLGLATEGPVAVDDKDETDEDSVTRLDTSSSHTRPESMTSVDSGAAPSGTFAADGNTFVDILALLSDFIGVDKSDLSLNTVLSDMGIDSLMAMELRSAIESECSTQLDEQLDFQSMTAGALGMIVNGATSETSDGSAKSVTTASLTAVSSTPLSVRNDSLIVPLDTIKGAFEQVKRRTDDAILEGGSANYIARSLPLQDDLCVALTLEAFDRLGSTVRTTKPGDQVPQFQFVSQHNHLVPYLYKMVERVSGLIRYVDGQAFRTEVPYAIRPSTEVRAELQETAPQEASANDMTFFAGRHLHDILIGKTDGIKLVFGTQEGRELVSRVYGDWPLNRIYYKQMEAFLTELVNRLPLREEGPLKILEMGAGTGGTTKWLVPLLAALGKPVEYTFTDLSPSFVAAARKRFKKYPFMKFRVHNIEQEPALDLLGTQHVVVASNAVHATRSMVTSTSHIRKALHLNGIIMMLEMTGQLYWVDMIFGLFEGWWLFEDGRQHAVANENQWRDALHTAGYGFADWTDGKRPENRVERLLIGVACEPQTDRTSMVSSPLELEDRQAAVDHAISEMSADFEDGLSRQALGPQRDVQVVVTGGTGSLGSHLVANLAERPSVHGVIILNRRHHVKPSKRQQEAFASRDISISREALEKLQVYETDTSKPFLGLSRETYAAISKASTHIIHAAWAMSANRPIQGFRSQFSIMRNMITLARDIASHAGTSEKVHFQLVSSIGVVGHYPLRYNTANVPEVRMRLESVLPNGYSDAKYACERALDETLHKHPEMFAASSVRIGQIAGAESSGYWNAQEHLPFLIKSAQTMNSLPQLHGLLSWTPVNIVAGTSADLALTDRPHPIYHIDNPIRQRWSEMLPVVAAALGGCSIVPFSEWIAHVRQMPGGVTSGNPAYMLVEFLEDNFQRMSCGGLLLETFRCVQHSPTLAAAKPVSEEVTRRYIAYWRRIGFLRDV